MLENDAYSTAVAQALELSLLDEDRFVRIFGDNDSFKKRVISVFIDSAPKVMGQLEQAYSDLDQEKINSCAHTLKGSASNIGGLRCAELAKIIELAAKDNDSQLVNEAFPVLRQTFISFSNMLAGMIKD